MPSWSTPAYSPDRSQVWPNSFYYLRTDSGGANLPGSYTTRLSNTASYHSGLPFGDLFRFEPFSTGDWDYSGSTLIPQVTANYFHDVWPGGTPTPTTWSISYPQGSTGNSHLYFANLRQENSFKGFFSGAYTAQGNGGYDRHAVLWAESVAYGQQLIEAFGYNGTSATATQAVTYDLTDYTLPMGTTEPAGVVAGRLPVAPFQFTYSDLVAAGSGDLGHMVGWVAANYANAHEWPARAGDGQLAAANYLKAGSVIRLSSSWTIPAGWPAPLKALARTLQRYGAVLFDKNSTLVDPSGGKAVISSVSDPAWPTGGSSFTTLWEASGPSLTDFEEVDITPLKVADGSIEVSLDPPPVEPSCSLTAYPGSTPCYGFVDYEITNPTAADSWFLLFGDGATTTLGGLTGNPATGTVPHVYPASGTYTVELRGYSATNVILTSCTAPVTVDCGEPPPPTECGATIVVNPSGTNPLQVQSTGSVSDPPWSVTEWEFDWGDGSPVQNNGSNPTATHTYATPGTYTINTCAVSVDVPGDFCCHTDIITVSGAEGCSLTVGNVGFVICNGAFTADLFINPVPDTPYVLLDWGDGTTEVTTYPPPTVPTHTYATCGNYTATATYWSGVPEAPGSTVECTATDDVLVVLVEPVDRADWPTPVPSSWCFGGIKVCVDSGSDPALVSYVVDWTDGSPPETYTGEVNPRYIGHDFDAPGPQGITVTFTIDGEPAGVCAVTLVSDCNLPPAPPLPVCTPTIEWTEVVSSGFLQPGSPVTTTSNSFRVDYEDSQNCGGVNPSTQSAQGDGQFTLTYDTTLSVVLDGLGELQETPYEIIDVYVKRPTDVTPVHVAQAVAAGGLLGCEMGPLETSFIGPGVTAYSGLRFDLPITAGLSVVQVTATTNDGRFHVDAYESATFYVGCPETPSAPSTNCAPGGTLGDGSDTRVLLVTRGASQVVAELTPTSGYFTRDLDTTSELEVTGVIPGLLDSTCCDGWAEIYPWVSEIMVYRDGRDVWSGPVTDVEFGYGTVTVRASDLTAWWDRRVVPDLNFVGEDVATIFQTVAAAAMSVDPVANFVISPTPTGLLADRQYVGVNYQYARDALDELAKTGIDWTCYGRTVLVGGDQVPGTPYFTILDDFFTEPPKVQTRGNDQATKVVVRGKGVTGMATATAAYTDAYGLLVRVFDEQDILDQSSATAAARTRLALLKDQTYIATPSGATLLPSAPITLEELIPGIRVRVASQATCRPVTGDFRLKKVKVDFDGKVSIDLQPLGTNEAEVPPRYPEMIVVGDSISAWSAEAAKAAGSGEPWSLSPTNRWQDLLVTDGLVGYSRDAAYPGVNTRNALASPRAPFQPCDLFVVFLGANDMVQQNRTFPPGPFTPDPASWVLPPEYQTNLVKLLDAYPAPVQLVVFPWKWNVNLVDSAWDTDLGAANRMAPYRAAAANAAAVKGARFLDLSTTYDAPSGTMTPLPSYLVDALIHSSDAGHRGIADRIKEVLSLVVP